MPKISKEVASKLKIPKNAIHVILFDKKWWKKKSAQQWLKRYHYEHRENTTSKNFYRFQQLIPQVIGATFYTIVLQNGIELVFQKYG